VLKVNARNQEQGSPKMMVTIHLTVWSPMVGTTDLMVQSLIKGLDPKMLTLGMVVSMRRIAVVSQVALVDVLALQKMGDSP
tara:strand:- start:16932 stop:17174 length:243 start_codon:yes stop_codon:yes gene_type:complete